MAKIFISYRRADSRLVTGRIYDHLENAFDATNIFIDVDDIDPGTDFRGALREATANCRVMLVIIGRKWLDMRDDAGNRRLDNPNDYVRQEFETGLERENVRVIPVLVDNTQMPSANALPDSIKDLAYKNAHQVDTNHRFKRDMETLINSIRSDVNDEQPKREIDWKWLITFVAVIVGLFGLWQGVFANNDNDAFTPTDNAVVVVDAEAPTLSPLEVAQATQTQDAIDFQLTLDAADATKAAVERLTATAFAPTQEAQLQATVDAILTETRAAILTENAPTLTHTPTVTPANTPDPVQAAFTPVARNADWTPVEREFDLPQGGTVTMVLVPAGCFDMGSTDEQIDYAVNELGADREWMDDEQPVDEVCFEQPLWIDKYEVTNEQYGSSGVWSGDDLPRENVNWFEASDFCEAREARLPTEAEQEYAARGPDALVYPWGDSYDAALVIGLDDPTSGTSPVGSRPDGASWVGAMDLSGNVWEWTSSLYEDYPYDATDGREDDTDNRTDVLRVLRGGSFFDPSNFLRAANRFNFTPNFVFSGIGFRCVRPPSQ